MIVRNSENQLLNTFSISLLQSVSPVHLWQFGGHRMTKLGFAGCQRSVDFIFVLRLEYKLVICFKISDLKIIALWWLSIIVLLKSHYSMFYPVEITLFYVLSRAEGNTSVNCGVLNLFFCSLSLTLSVPFPSARILVVHDSIYRLLFVIL